MFFAAKMNQTVTNFKAVEAAQLKAHTRGIFTSFFMFPALTCQQKVSKNITITALSVVLAASAGFNVLVYKQYSKLYYRQLEINSRPIPESMIYGKEFYKA